jgi:hypothetical protein
MGRNIIYFIPKEKFQHLPLSNLLVHPAGIGDRGQFWLSCLDLLIFLLTMTYRLFGFQIFWP